MRRARKGKFTIKNDSNSNNILTERDLTSVPIEDEDIKIYKKSENSLEEPQKMSSTLSSGKKFEKSKKNKKNKKTDTIIIFYVSLVVIILSSVIGMFLGGLFGGSSTNSNTDFIKPVDKATGRVNVLILGVDKEGLRTDTIMVASYDIDEKTVNVLSIPRDTRMYIGSKYQKINSAHAITKNGKIKGPQGTIEAVTRLTGIPINYYVEFDFEAFRKTIDTLDGVYFNVPQVMKYTDKTQDLYINLAPGYQKLNGDKAEQLVRFRQYPEGDIKRIRVQQEFLMALAEQKLTPEYISKVPELFGNVICKYVTTNLKLNDVAKYSNTLEDLDLESIQMHELPGEYSGSDWKPDLDKIRELVETYFECDASNITAGKPGTISENSATKKPTSTVTATKSPVTTPNEDDDDEKETTAPTSAATKTPAASKRPSVSQTTSKPSATAKPTKRPVAETSSPSKTPETTVRPTQAPSKEPVKTPTPTTDISLEKPSGRPSGVVETE